MILQKNSSTGSFPIIILVLSVLLYCGGFFRVELVLSQHQGRIIVLEEAVERLKTIVNGNRTCSRMRSMVSLCLLRCLCLLFQGEMLSFSFSLEGYIIVKFLSNISVALGETRCRIYLLDTSALY